MKYLVGVCSKNHKNLVLKDRGDANEADINALKRQAKEYGAYFNRSPQCYVCKEPFASETNLTVTPGDDASYDRAAEAIHKVFSGDK